MSLKHFYHPTSKKLRKIGDAFLYGSAGMATVVMGMPIKDNTKLWINSALGAIGVIAKFITNCFKSDEENVAENENN